VSIAVSKVVNVDIENLKIEVNSGFNLTREIEDQATKVLERGEHINKVNFDSLVSFGRDLVTKGNQWALSLPTQREAKQIDAFVKKLF
jgi:hypothetical protein